MSEHTNESRYTSAQMSTKDWQLLILSLIPSAVMVFGGSIHHETWLRIYTPLFHLIILLLAYLAAGKRKPTAAVGFLLCCDATLILTGFFHSSLFLCCANCLVIPALTALSMLSLAGISRSPVLSVSGIRESLLRSLRGLFEYIPLPIASQLVRDKNRTNTLALGVLSLCICTPVVIIVLALLANADMVFLSWCDMFFEWLDHTLSSPAVLRVPLMLIAALMIFSWLFTLRQPVHELSAPPAMKIPSLFPSMLLPMLNIIYGMFVYIQFSNLFGGAETAAMTGGYAEYARSGFFQLVAVSGINLCVLALSIHSGRSSWIRMMSGLLIALTGVILVSAFWRMRLYIQVYGLSVLRVMTLWGMLAILLLLTVSAIALLKPGFKAFAAGMICILVLWVSLNAVDIDRMIAEYNVYHFISGDLEELDREYIRSLSPSANAVIDKFERQN